MLLLEKYSFAVYTAKISKKRGLIKFCKMITLTYIPNLSGIGIIINRKFVAFHDGLITGELQ